MTSSTFGVMLIASSDFRDWTLILSSLMIMAFPCLVAARGRCSGDRWSPDRRNNHGHAPASKRNVTCAAVHGIYLVINERRSWTVVVKSAAANHSAPAAGADSHHKSYSGSLRSAREIRARAPYS